MTMPTRRAVLAVGLALLAGCSGSPDEPSGTSPTATPESQSPSPVDGQGTGTRSAAATQTPTLDLREANVVDVAVGGPDGGAFQLDITLYHDDDGEGGYADWWQVETLDGERLGRRDLAHAHSTAPFTRSETITVPEDVDCIVVRGHDRTHGYGGQAMLVALPGGEARVVQQGPEPQQFETADCP